VISQCDVSVKETSENTETETRVKMCVTRGIETVDAQKLLFFPISKPKISG
jgi:hypothetical protein